MTAPPLTFLGCQAGEELSTDVRDRAQDLGDLAKSQASFLVMEFRVDPRLSHQKLQVCNGFLI